MVVVVIGPNLLMTPCDPLTHAPFLCIPCNCCSFSF